MANSDSQSEYLFTKGMGYFLQEDYTNAIDYFERALKESQKNSAIYYKLGESYYLRGSFHRGIQYIEKAIEIDSDNLPYYLVLADIYIAQQEYILAAEVYENMLENNPDVIEYYYETAHLYKQIGMMEADNLKSFLSEENGSSKQRKELQTKVTNPLKKATLFYNKFEKSNGISEEVSYEKFSIYSYLGKNTEATKELNNLIKEYPKNPEYKVKLARFYYQIDENEKAVDYLENESKSNPHESEYHMALAEMYKLEGNDKKSNEHLMAVFASPSYSIHNKVKIISGMLQSTDPNKRKLALEMAKRTAASNADYPQAHSILGDAYYVNRDNKNARKAFLESLKLDKKKYLVWEQLVFIDVELEDYDALIEHANTCLEIYPNKAAILYYLGAAYLHKKENNKARNTFEIGLNSVKNNPGLEFQFQTQLGDLYNTLKLYKKADSTYESALVYDPNSAHVLNNYSYFLSVRGEKLEMAKSMSGKLIKIHPNEPTYIDTYAWVLYKMEDYKGAEKYLAIALKNSNDPAIVEHYGDALFKLGREKEALKYWKEAQGQKGVTDFLDQKVKEGRLYE